MTRFFSPLPVACISVPGTRKKSPLSAASRFMFLQPIVFSTRKNPPGRVAFFHHSPRSSLGQARDTELFWIFSRFPDFNRSAAVPTTGPVNTDSRYRQQFGICQ
jgi:hypothetical protein